jgi:methylamine utilization protein MauE
VAVVVASALFVAAAILALAGIAKIRDPRPAELALSSVGLPVSVTSVRVLGSVEVLIGLLVYVWPTRGAALGLATAYLAFAIFILYLRALPGHQERSCGCLGRAATPPTVLHALVNLTAVGFGVAAAAVTPPSLLTLLQQEGSLAPFYVIAAISIAWLSVAVVIYVPPLFSSYARPPKGESHEHLSAEEALLQAGITLDDPSLYPGVAVAKASSDVH